MILVTSMYKKAWLVFSFVHVLKICLGNETIKYVFANILPPLDIYGVHLFVGIFIFSNFVSARVLSKRDDRFPPKIFDDGDCSVCMSPHVNPSRPITCGHTFCYECLISWCRIKITCPICKQVFTRLQRTSDDDGQTRIITINKDFLMPFFDFDMTTLTLELIGDFFYMVGHGIITCLL
jgi:hypothetical protein